MNLDFKKAKQSDEKTESSLEKNKNASSLSKSVEVPLPKGISSKPSSSVRLKAVGGDSREETEEGFA